MNKILFSFSKYLCSRHFNPKASYSQIYKCTNFKPNLKCKQFSPQFHSVSYSHSIREPLVTYEELREISDSKKTDVVLIDVREPEELAETGVLPSSINIPLGSLENVLKEMSDEEFLRVYGRGKPNKNQVVIFSCKLGKRSAAACEISRQLGFVNVRNYIGGWLEWDEKNQSVLNVSESFSAEQRIGYEQVSYEEVVRLKDNPNYILIDVREPSELAENGSIPGSINIPLDNLEKALIEMTADEFKTNYGRDKPSKDTNIIFSCRSGRRSYLAQEKAVALGFKNALNYAGSFLDWEEKRTKQAE